MEDDKVQRLNPWVSMCTEPGATIQQIVDTDPKRMVLLLAATGGFAGVLSSAGDRMEWPLLLLSAVIAGPIIGLIDLYIGGALIGWIGRRMGGMASTQHIRAAMAWSNVPLIWGLLLWIPARALFGEELYSTVGVAIGIWSFVVFLNSLGQLQGFSVWRSLGNTVLAYLVVVGPVILIVLIVVGIQLLAG